ncbi:ferric reductase [Trypanosoma grayi]|uniref:ferric reductase n=1 Tax=Trypanosoma grayi TaxID=71804 RepID=UPI0004F4952C|nr:ferric reductase [Trypanosoma grayi]KEG06593.1 ferric reductase [Trypanosoma grayi]
MLLLFFLYWIQGHNFNSYWTGGADDGMRKSERWARSLGQLAVAFLSLCIFPASRNSLLHSILGTAWESSIWVHKVLGYGMLLATTGHMVAWYVRYSEVGMFPRGIFSIPPVEPPGHVDNFTVPLITLTTWFMLLAMGVFALEPVRRRFFELFYYLHVAAFYMIAPTVLWHAAAAWEYFLPGLTVWFVDRLLRMHRSASAVVVVSAVASGSFVDLRFRHAALSAAPGQYAFVNIPELSLLQWHPFSLSGDRDGCYTFHIRSMGEGTWTGRLVKLVCERGSNFTLSVDGPCGRVQDFEDYRSVVLVAGGIGVTPCAAIYSHLRQQRMESLQGCAVTLLWTVRDAELVPMMSHLWDDVDVMDLPSDEGAESGAEARARSPSGATSTVRVFFTGDPCCATLCDKRVPMVAGRLDLAAEIPRSIASEAPGEVLVFVCGPPGLVRSARDVALRLGAHFHEESFFL